MATRSGLYARLFALSLAHSNSAQQRIYGDVKRRLFDGISGTIVEIGAGAGPNARFFPIGCRWIAVEPNVHFHRYLRKEAKRRKLDLEVIGGMAETLPLADASADAVVSTLVLCSVDEMERVLREVRRVLKPEGRLYIMEHVAAPRGSARRSLQRTIKPLWKVLADGCRPDRETANAVEGAGFRFVWKEPFNGPPGPIRPHFAGVAVVGDSAR